MRVITVASRRAAMIASKRRRLIVISALAMIGCSELKMKNSHSRSHGLDMRGPI
jgi:hypothetical protein